VVVVPEEVGWSIGLEGNKPTNPIGKPDQTHNSFSQRKLSGERRPWERDNLRAKGMGLLDMVSPSTLSPITALSLLRFFSFPWIFTKSSQLSLSLFQVLV
jgi:hypothetical protein